MLEHGDRKGMSLKGEANQLSADDIANQRKAFKAKLKLLSEEHGVKLPCIYNADQTGLYYRKLPNRMFVSPEKRKKARGTKLMKDKDRITVMVCVAADGSQQPLCVVGTAIEPRCFKSLTDWHKQLTVQGTPCFYTNQSKAWFDTTVTLWWFNTVFLPAHRKKHGGAIAILLLDNFKAHKKALPEGKAHGGQVYVLYFPENMTAVIQPCDMGLINGLKCGYKVDLLHRALELADDPEALARALESAKLLQKSLGQGSQGIDDGHKANVLDAMFILEKIWTGDRHCQPRAVSNCWRKSNCLPQELEEALEDCADETRDYTKLNDKDLERFCAVFNTIEISAAVENPAPLFENIQLAHNQPALEPAEANNICLRVGEARGLARPNGGGGRPHARVSLEVVDCRVSRRSTPNIQHEHYATSTKPRACKGRVRGRCARCLQGRVRGGLAAGVGLHQHQAWWPQRSHDAAHSTPQRNCARASSNC